MFEGWEFFLYIVRKTLDASAFSPLNHSLAITFPSGCHVIRWHAAHLLLHRTSEHLLNNKKTYFVFSIIDKTTSHFFLS